MCDVFDRAALIEAVRDFRPDIILNELTDLPDDVRKIGDHSELNARIRTEGNQNLIDAARQSGSPKILAQYRIVREAALSGAGQAKPL
ncbi:MAG: hypothetical protein JWN95_655 [Frankiales bacterium]|nr:hypothetical protein [Frankiales bacterium]